MIKTDDSGPWSALLEKHRPLLLPAAHDGLTARLIEDAGFLCDGDDMVIDLFLGSEIARTHAITDIFFYCGAK